MADKTVPLRQRLEERAAGLGCVINPLQAHKIPLMEASGHCACTPNGSRTCPCDLIGEEIEEYGACLCRVIVTPAYRDRVMRREQKKDPEYVKRCLEENVYGAKPSSAEQGADAGHDGPVEDVPPPP